MKFIRRHVVNERIIRIYLSSLHSRVHIFKKAFKIKIINHIFLYLEICSMYFFSLMDFSSQFN